ncbi:chromate transporter [Aquabacter spiritensis]|uniref:Chromate transporter n=1 Tax=Aquabacter spiritensis TaxID=933073 RepID=A0A4R3LVS7_9HYPH|nr:chromate transporter [Aquabacter spiritensis]TCT04701.1 chromate transporter [Aquabacter spiritensis]
MSSGDVEAGLEDEQASPTVSDLFLTFLRVAISGFGGALPFARRELVERRKWLDPREFNDLLSICQLMPGPNIVNMSFCLGARFHGVLGAAAAFSGIIVVPCIIAILLAALYLRYGQVPEVSGTLRGVAAAAIGLFVGMGMKMAYVERRSPHILVFALLAFLGAGPLGFPLPMVILVLAPFSIAAAWRWSK